MSISYTLSQYIIISHTKTLLGFSMQDKVETTPGCLFVVATPIGNLNDISSRAIFTLQDVDLIACEDTRHTKKLCSHLHISTRLTSYYRENEKTKSIKLLALLHSGQSIALVSDAGTPGLSDPGAVLVNLAREADIPIQAVAGPSALSATLSIAGITDTAFYFGGFPPSKNNQREQFFKSLKSLPCPLIFYESPHRIKATLEALLKTLGDREAKLFRELTKVYEECIMGTLTTLINRVNNGIKGELVLVINGANEPEKVKPMDINELILWYRDEQRVSLKDAVRNIATDLDLPRTQVYKKALELWKIDQ